MLDDSAITPKQKSAVVKAVRKLHLRDVHTDRRWCTLQPLTEQKELAPSPLSVEERGRRVLKHVSGIRRIRGCCELVGDWNCAQSHVKERTLSPDWLVAVPHHIRCRRLSRHPQCHTHPEYHSATKVCLACNWQPAFTHQWADTAHAESWRGASHPPSACTSRR